MNELDETLKQLDAWSAVKVAAAARLHPQTVRNIRRKDHAPNWETLQKLRQAVAILHRDVPATAPDAAAGSP